MARTVTLVNEHGSPIGTAEIMEAHTGTGKLHKAFSVYVFRKDGQEILMQQRSIKKMLWPLIWANTCCSHPFENETPTAAGERRLQEELGFTVPLTPLQDFVYRAEDPSGKGVEHEHVTLLLGTGDTAAVHPNPDEVAAYQWINVEALRALMKKKPDDFAPWFHLGMEIVWQHSPRSF